jgi:predicted transcriptional regulator of viral defense system
MDWSKFIAEDSRTRAVIHSDLVAKQHGISLRSVHAALKRQEKKGFVEHISRRIFLNKLARGFEQRELINVVRPDAYISLDSALAEWGISKQVPNKLTCVSPSFSRDINSSSIHISLHTIKRQLYWGITKKKGRYLTYRIAEPEKALLDWIYFQRKNALPVATDEFILDTLDRSRLLDYAKKFPKGVQDDVRSLMLSTLVEAPKSDDKRSKRTA